MRIGRASCVVACLAALFIRPASANLLKADFSGIAISAASYIPSQSLGCPAINAADGDCYFPKGVAFTASIVFDTSLGQMSSTSPGQYQLRGGDTCCGSPAPTNPLISASITLAGVGTFANGGFSLSLLRWQDDGLGSLTVTQAGALSGNSTLFLDTTPGQSFLQTGTCPGRPCAELFIQSATLTDISSVPVPGAMAGAGIPGVTLLAGLLLWRNRRYGTTP